MFNRKIPNLFIHPFMNEIHIQNLFVFFLVFFKFFIFFGNSPLHNFLSKYLCYCINIREFLILTFVNIIE